jgi:FKBP-type peptidyl-prolyl cis-trans isomerase (trigger factor)
MEIEILNQLIDKAKIDEIPEVLINAERQKIFYELKRDLERAGVSIEKYLEDIKKTEEDLFNDFKDQAVKRAKAALVSRQVALDNDIKVLDEELDAEMNMMKEMYKDNKEYTENLNRPDVRDSIAVSMQNKKVMQWLKAKILGENLINDKNLAELGCKDCKDGHDHEKHKHNEKKEKDEKEKA